MKNFMKISVIFLASFFLCLPLSARDDSPEDKKVLRVSRFYMKETGIWNVEYENGAVQDLELSPQATEELLQQIEKEKLESDLPRDQDYARDLGGAAKTFVQIFVPGGVPLTTATGILAERFFGTPTLVEGAVKYARPMESIEPVFKGSKKVLNLSGTHRIVNLGLCKPQNLRNSYKGQLAPILPRESLTTSFMGGGVTYVEFLMSEDAASQESADALWEIRKVKGKEEKESHYIIVHSNSEQLLTYTQALLGGPWSGYYCHVEKHPESLEKRFLWNIYYLPDEKAHLLKNLGCHPGLFCYTKGQSQNGPFGQVLIQSIGSQFKVEEYCPDGLHRSSIKFRLPKNNYDKKPLSPPSLLPPPSERPPVNDRDGFVFGGNGYISSAPGEKEREKEEEEDLSYDLVDDSDDFDGDGYISPGPEEKDGSYDFGEEDEWGFAEAHLGLTNGLYRIRNCDLSSLAKNSDRNPNVGLLLPISSKPSQSGYDVGVLDAQHSAQYNVADQKDLWEIYQVEDGCYTIKNHAFLDGGFLTWQKKTTYSGYYGQVLADNGRYSIFNSYPTEKLEYSQAGKYRHDVLWRLTEELHNGSIYYTLKNRGDTFKSDEGGFLCYTSDLSPVGPHVQILDSSIRYFKQDKEKYKKPNGEFWPSILWELVLQSSLEISPS